MSKSWFLLLVTQAINSWARQGTAWKLQTQLWVQSAGFLGPWEHQVDSEFRTAILWGFQVEESRILESVTTHSLEAYMFNPAPKFLHNFSI